MSLHITHALTHIPWIASCLSNEHCTLYARIAFYAFNTTPCEHSSQIRLIFRSFFALILFTQAKRILSHSSAKFNVQKQQMIGLIETFRKGFMHCLCRHTTTPHPPRRTYTLLFKRFRPQLNHSWVTLLVWFSRSLCTAVRICRWASMWVASISFTICNWIDSTNLECSLLIFFINCLPYAFYRRYLDDVTLFWNYKSERERERGAPVWASVWSVDFTTLDRSESQQTICCALDTCDGRMPFSAQRALAVLCCCTVFV